MKKDKTFIIMIFLFGLVCGLIIQNFFNVIYSKNLENSLDLNMNIKLTRGESFIQIDNQSNLPENGAIIDYDGSISKKLEINQTK